MARQEPFVKPQIVQAGKSLTAKTFTFFSSMIKPQKACVENLHHLDTDHAEEMKIWSQRQSECSVPIPHVQETAATTNTAEPPSLINPDCKTPVGNA